MNPDSPSKRDEKHPPWPQLSLAVVADYTHLLPREREAVAGRPFDKWGEMDETYKFVHEFKPELFGAKLEEATAERNKAQAEAADPKVPPLAAPGTLNQHNRAVDIVNSRPSGNSIPYLVSRLKRDHPQIADALARKEYPSARAAGIAAGIVKVPTPLETILRLVRRLTRADWLLLQHGLTQRRSVEAALAPVTTAPPLTAGASPPAPAPGRGAGAGESP